MLLPGMQLAALAFTALMKRILGALTEGLIWKRQAELEAWIAILPLVISFKYRSRNRAQREDTCLAMCEVLGSIPTLIFFLLMTFPFFFFIAYFSPPFLPFSSLPLSFLLPSPPSPLSSFSCMTVLCSHLRAFGSTSYRAWIAPTHRSAQHKGLVT